MKTIDQRFTSGTEAWLREVRRIEDEAAREEPLSIRQPPAMAYSMFTLPASGSQEALP